MIDYTANSCSFCNPIPTALVNRAEVTGTYTCPAGCTGAITAVSEETVTEVVNVTLDKSVCPTCVRAGDTVRYTITLCNCSSMAITNVLITDPGIEEILEVGTIYLNGRAVAGGNLRAGIPITRLSAGSCACITFEATIPADAEGPISNTAFADYTFATAQCPVQHAEAVSTVVELNVSVPGLEIVKEAQPCFVTPEAPQVTYTLTVTNPGNCTITGAVVTDLLGDGLTYVAGSTSVNGDDPVNLDPTEGITLGTLDPGQTVVITFRAQAGF